MTMIEFGSGMALAIDFGSSNTAAAFRDRHGHVQEVRLSATGTLMPSGVFFDGSRFLVGRTALQAAFTSPESFEPSPKRRLADREIFLAGSMVPVTKMVAAVFAEVLAKSSGVMGGTPDVIVVTHPDQWSGPLQELLAEGARAGGVDPNRMRMVSEAQAAAWFYAKSATEVPVGSRLVVFDFGAGTCDVAVLDKQADQTFAVIASDGLDGLGGQDLDARIQAWVRRQLAISDPVLLAEVNEPSSIASRLTLNDRIRDAKEALSEASSAAIVVAAGANTQVLQLTRDEFDEIIGSDIGRAVDLTNRVMAEAEERVPSSETPTIYLTGGSSHIPLVHSRLGELGPLGVLGDPKTVVVQGALYTPQASATPSARPAQPPPSPSTPSLPPPQAPGEVPHPATQSAPAMAGWNSGPVPTPAPAFSGPLPVQQLPPGGTGSSTKKWVIAGIGLAAVALAAVIALATAGVFTGGGKPSPTPTASASSSATSTSVSESARPVGASAPLSGDNARLLALLPRGYGSDSCTPVDPPVEDALATLDCTGNSEPGGPTSSRYSLFADANALARQFQLTVNEDAALTCPGNSDATPGTWHYNSTPNQEAGSVACGTYKGTPEVVWTNGPQLVLGDAQGPDLNAVHRWWLKYA